MAGQQWSASADGGYLSNNVLSRQIRHASQPIMRFAQFVRPEPGYGKNKGDRVYFDRIANVSNQGGTIGESNTMPETKVVISQGSAVVTEYGNSIPYTGKLESLAEFNPDNIIQKALLNDQAKAIDYAIATELKTCKVKYTPTGTDDAPSGTYATSGTCITAATRNIQTFDVKGVADYLKATLLAPKIGGDNGYYVCVASTGFLRCIQDDDDFVKAVQYGRPEDLYAGEVGMYYGIRFIETTFSSALAGTIGSYKGGALMFGDDAIVEAVTVAPEIRAKVPTDYGRSKGLAWYAMMGYSLTYDTAVAGEGRIVQFAST